ncbi:MAG TPA: glycosyltransferase family 39 protein [Acidobacteriota bacterium]|nr:glycosyltransferase family 39 protein [Acidobacteriota bacterium]
MKYSIYLIEHKKLPVNHHITSLYDPVAWIFNEFEYAQPPLYYLINVPAALLPNPMLGSRLFSVFISSITLWLLIISALQIFRRYELGAVLMTSLAGLNPVFLRIGSSVSNDNLAWLLSLIVFRLFLQDREFKRKWLFGLLIGLGILTKASFLIWLIFPFVRILISRRKWPRPTWLNFSNPIFTSVIAFVLCGWWLVRNRALYGDWTGIIGGSGLPGEFLNTASLYIFQDFLKSAMQFTFFPVVEEQSSFILPIIGFVLFLVIGFFVHFQKLEHEFKDKRDPGDFALFTILNLLFFLYANLHWNLSETRHLAIGLLPLLSLVCAVLMRTLGKFSVPVAILINATYLSVLW